MQTTETGSSQTRNRYVSRDTLDVAERFSKALARQRQLEGRPFPEKRNFRRATQSIRRLKARVPSSKSTLSMVAIFTALLGTYAVVRAQRA